MYMSFRKLDGIMGSDVQEEDLYELNARSRQLLFLT